MYYNGFYCSLLFLHLQKTFLKFLPYFYLHFWFLAILRVIAMHSITNTKLNYIVPTDNT